MMGWCVAALTTTDRAGHPVPEERVKRWLNYPINGGLAKTVFGIVVPIHFHHPLPRVIVNTYNLQASYRIPANIIYPTPETIFNNRAFDQPQQPDAARAALYAVLERSFDRPSDGAIAGSVGRNGRACLLRAICEVAATPFAHNGLIGEIIDVIFTPNPSEAIDPVYRLAQERGRQQHDCLRLYPSCPKGLGIFDSISFVVQQQQQQL
ncbi:uncharacterized protein LOC126572953 [Anopheles aquasalis]|uniref:uncharacterized protein LOC126572953 n=1 Tax=Anopheles aquasalis TaxID=42839 RepID=UPI00215B6958|nr:uncharacterized protein LOC126572953 [Anopheles aquasalis]